MKPCRAKSECSGFTLVEVLVLMVVIAILLAMLLPAKTGHGPRSTAMCLSNQRQIAIGLTMFADDYGNEYPWQISTTNGGSLEFIAGDHAFPHYRALAAYLGKQPRIFVCPTDTRRFATRNFAQLVDTNLSYFLNLTVTPSKNVILSGDRHLEAGGKNVQPGAFLWSTNIILKWTRELHSKNGSGPCGMLSFCDGHVQFTRNETLNSCFQSQPSATDRLVVP
jgi:prepilin-type N-terminal cleavage/methylation domain-containing protein